VKAIVAAALVLCGCRHEERRVLASIDTPVKAEIVAVTGQHTTLVCGGGHGGGICVPRKVDDAVTELRVHGPRALTMVVAHSIVFPPDGVDLVADAEGKRLAYRRRPDRSWSVVYLGHEGRAFVADAMFGEPPVDWSKVPLLVDLVRQRLEADGSSGSER